MIAKVGGIERPRLLGVNMRALIFGGRSGRSDMRRRGFVPWAFRKHPSNRRFGTAFPLPYQFIPRSVVYFAAGTPARVESRAVQHPGDSALGPTLQLF